MPEITLCKYDINISNWESGFITSKLLLDIKQSILKYPFKGVDPHSYGLVEPIIKDDYLFFKFIHKFPTVLIDYIPETKEEKRTDVLDSADFYVILNLNNLKIYIQSRRSSEFPKKNIILKRVQEVVLDILLENNLIFEKFTESKILYDREKLVKIFYEQADEILEIEFSNFDSDLIIEEKKRRNNKRQVYFNPIEAYNEAMEESAIRLADNAESALIKAKENGNLKKDPITRAMLEGSREPQKMTYTKNGALFHCSSIANNKEKIDINESDDIDLRIKKIIEKIEGTMNAFGVDGGNDTPNLFNQGE